MMITYLLSTTYAVLIYKIQSNLESGQTSHNSLNLYNIVYTSTASEGEPYLCLLGFSYLQRVWRSSWRVRLLLWPLSLSLPSPSLLFLLALRRLSLWDDSFFELLLPENSLLHKDLDVDSSSLSVDLWCGMDELSAGSSEEMEEESVWLPPLELELSDDGSALLFVFLNLRLQINMHS